MNLEIIFSFFSQNFTEIVIGVIIFGLAIWMFISREDLGNKVENEPVSFTAMILSITLALIGFVTQPEQLAIASFSTISGTQMIVFISVFVIILPILMVTAGWFIIASRND